MPTFKELILPHLSTADKSNALISRIASSLDNSAIREAFGELVHWELVKNGLQPWDGDNSDIISYHQGFISEVLSAVPRDLLPFVAIGLEHESQSVRFFTAVALQERGDPIVLEKMKTALDRETYALTRKVLAKAIAEHERRS